MFRNRSPFAGTGVETLPDIPAPPSFLVPRSSFLVPRSSFLGAAAPGFLQTKVSVAA
ncbi:MAG: hypothetical protein LIO63_02180 [Akkermansia sp.]|nr:hypothetical protein [Akkermansia sp.]